MENKELCAICLLNKHCQLNFDYYCQNTFDYLNARNIDISHHKTEELIKCEFIDLCQFKYSNGNQYKSWCVDLKSLNSSFAYCKVRKEVYTSLGNPND